MTSYQKVGHRVFSKLKLEKGGPKYKTCILWIPTVSCFPKNTVGAESISLFSENWKILRIVKHFHTQKKKVAPIFTKISPYNNRFSWISKLQKFLWYLFSFMSYREKIGLHVFFNSAHFLFFYFFIFTVLKVRILWNLNVFEFFW